MKLPVAVKVKQITIQELMSSYKYEEVLGYCSQCNNFENNHSCPRFTFNTAEYLEPYNFATVVMTKIETEMIKKHFNLLKDKVYMSRVYNNYQKSHPGMIHDWNSRVSMYAFNDIKDKMSEGLLIAEKAFSGSISLPPGSCTRCETCLKQFGKACAVPQKLRYSLEALGFLVSEIYSKVFNLELGWAKGELPDSFNSCSAIVTKEPINVDRLISVIGELELTL